MTNDRDEKEAERQQRLAERHVMLQQRAEARKFRTLLDQSSLSEESLYVVCEIHGRQARDPFTDECILCSLER